MSSNKQLTTYTINKKINDPVSLRAFVNSYFPNFYTMSYDAANQTVKIVVAEPTTSVDTANALANLVQEKFPNDAAPVIVPVTQESENAPVGSDSVYGYFPLSPPDGNVTISTNTTLTKNMYYYNLTVPSGVRLNANGWRIVVSGTLQLDGIISNDGSDAVGAQQGMATSTQFTTYLGPGTHGGAGLTSTNYGNNGIVANYQCSGGVGGDGGSAGDIYNGGSAGMFSQISMVDGGVNALSILPTAFMGRLLSTNFYVMGGTGGGGGGCVKGTAITIASGGGGGGGGFLVLCARTFLGTGTVSAKGGNGGNATMTGTPTTSIAAGGGGGGGGGCIVIVTQSGVPDSITLNVAGGIKGTGISSGVNGTDGQPGNKFTIRI